jgi:hypothetical protein
VVWRNWHRERERDIEVPYHPPETPSGLEELAQGNPDGDKKETSKEKNEYNDIKKLLEYLIEQNKTLAEKV